MLLQAVVVEPRIPRIQPWGVVNTETLCRISLRNCGRTHQRGYSREGNREEMLDKLQMMYENARNEKEREALRRCLEQMNQA